jgi:hypothetical protein
VHSGQPRFFAGIFSLVQRGTPPLWAGLANAGPWSTTTKPRSFLEQRQTVLDVAYRVHPERFVHQAPKPIAVPTEVWINKPLNSNEKTHKIP